MPFAAAWLPFAAAQGRKRKSGILRMCVHATHNKTKGVRSRATNDFTDHSRRGESAKNSRTDQSRRGVDTSRKRPTILRNWPIRAFRADPRRSYKIRDAQAQRCIQRLQTHQRG